MGLKCILEQNDCYRKYKTASIIPSGIVVHSTDVAGKVLKRFVQPGSGQVDGMSVDGVGVCAGQMLDILGKNEYNNDWNRAGVSAAVHAFMGTTARGDYAVCQTLPYTMPCWGAGSGKKGSYNGCLAGKVTPPLYIQFEMIEDSAGDKDHARRLYDLAVDFCVQRMLEYPTIKAENIVSHSEACRLGYATNHGDPESYWKKCGLPFTMDGFRKDVKAALEAAKKPDGGEDVTRAEVQKMIDEALEKSLGKYIADISDVPSEAVKVEVRRLLDCGAINGGTPASVNPDDINLPYNILRSVVMSERYTDYIAGGGDTVDRRI